MKKRKLYYIAFILLLLCGCTKEASDLFDDEPINKDGSIAFLTQSVQTKGTPQNDLTNYKKVDLIVYNHTGDYSVSKTLFRQTELEQVGTGADMKWAYTPPMFWPEGDKLSFLAYASDIAYATASGQPGVFINGAAKDGAPTIEYIVPEQVDKQPDLLVTALLNQSKVSNVTLPMKHALACVSFCASGPSEMKVKQIRVNNVYSKGKFVLDDTSITWTDLDGKNVTAIEPGIDTDKPLEDDPTKYNYLMTPNGYLMMVPQALTDATIDVTYWKGVNGTERSTTYILPTDVPWKAGMKYIYKFGESLEEVLVYYEKYEDGSYGLHSRTNTNFNSLDETKKIVEAGYGVLSKSELLTSDKPLIKVGAGAAIPSTKIESVSKGYNLYAISQTGTSGVTTFELPVTPAPVDVFFDGNGIPCGKIIPHCAKGVYPYGDIPEYAIRTPQQMRNISVLTTGAFDGTNPTYTIIPFRQERDLDFSTANSSIGGGELNGPIVDQYFCGTYTVVAPKSISNVRITSGESNVGVFSQSIGTLNDVVLKASSISGGDNVGGIVGHMFGSTATINRPRIIGTADDPASQINITGGSFVGGIVGLNQSTINGTATLEVATEITVAEVSGWVNITGAGSYVGGVAGSNQNWDTNGSINMVLVNGVFVTGPNQGDLIESKIKITGNDNVGGIAGVNWVKINGNVTGTVNDKKNMPDVAGIVEIRGANWVGGITGLNATSGTLNSVNIRLGRATPMIIDGTGWNVGGIVGENNGELGTESDDTFISARGNIKISGDAYVGGIVGKNNAPGAKLENCFVYDFQTQKEPIQYFAPEITSRNGFAGGIAGQNVASIKNSCVFSVSSATITITASKDAGGIAGYCETANSNLTNCSFVGSVEVKATSERAGGILGSNTSGTITNCWVGNSDGNSVIKNAIANLGLVVTVPAGQTTYGIPNITGGTPGSQPGGIYIGGIVGLNSGIIEGVTLSDNVTIGRPYTNGTFFDGSNGVGGIVGGNATTGVVRGCKVENKPANGSEREKIVAIRGGQSVGGIVGLNNGVVENCSVRATAEAARLTIRGLGIIGGVVGQNGGHSEIGLPNDQGGDVYGTGGDMTKITGSTVTGYVTIQGEGVNYGTATDVGGIIGLNGPTRDNLYNISGCKVKGDAANSIVISAARTTGGIVGTNDGNVFQCDVYNATITSNAYYAGGIAGRTNATGTAFSPPKSYRSNLFDCRVYATVTINGYNDVTNHIAPGAFVGYVNILGSISFGSASYPSLIHSSGVTVNGAAPTGKIVGFTSTNPDGTATMNCNVQAFSPR